VGDQAVNQPPVITSTSPLEATVGTLYSYNLTGYDLDNDPIYWNPVSGLCWSRCAVKGLLFQQVQVLSRQRSFQPGSYPSGHGGNEGAEAWGKETALGRLQVGRP